MHLRPQIFFSYWLQACSTCRNLVITQDKENIPKYYNYHHPKQRIQRKTKRSLNYNYAGYTNKWLLPRYSNSPNQFYLNHLDRLNRNSLQMFFSRKMNKPRRAAVKINQNYTRNILLSSVEDYNNTHKLKVSILRISLYTSVSQKKN